MLNKIAYCFWMVMILILAITNVAMANDYSNEGAWVYELQVVYPISGSYISDFGIGMQGKYYMNEYFHVGWYTPVRSIFPLEQKREDSVKVNYDIQAKLMGVVGCTLDTEFIMLDASVLAGWRYWWTKSSIHNDTYNIHGSYKSSTTSYEWGVMSTMRWKVGETFGFQDQPGGINVDMYVYLPMTEGLNQCLGGAEVALGLSYMY